LGTIPASSAIRKGSIVRSAGAGTESYRLSGWKSSIEVVPGQVLVKYRSGAAFTGALGAAVIGGVPARGVQLLKLPAGMPVSAAVAQLSRDPNVEYAEPNRVYRPQRVPSDPLYPMQYGLSIISAAAAWEFDTGATNTVTIAVIDTGIDTAQPDLAFGPKVWSTMNAGFDPISGSGSSENPPAYQNDPDCDHGTEVSGVASATGDNGVEMTGVSWGAKLLSLRVFASTTGISLYDHCANTNDAAIQNAIAYAQSLYASSSSVVGRMVINMSLGEPQLPGGGCGPGLTSAVTAAIAAGIPVVAAAGNDPASGVMCPGAIPGVIAAEATDKNDNSAYFSSAGPEAWVAAPGVDVLTLEGSASGGRTASVSGTSFSSPHVAGLIALMLSAQPSLTPAQVANDLKLAADDLGPPGFDNLYGWGRINAFKTMRLIERGTLSDFAGEQKVIAFPNPAHFSSGSVTFALPPGLQGSNLSIKLYTMSGELVKTLNGNTWDGRNDAGLMVATGTYIFLVKTDNGQARGRVAVVH
jgi:subtilisin family serine protease